MVIMANKLKGKKKYENRVKHFEGNDLGCDSIAIPLIYVVMRSMSKVFSVTKQNA